MLGTAVVGVIWGIVQPIINRVPDITINYDGIANSTVYQFIRAGLYFFPMGTVKTILTIIIALWVLRVVIAVLHSLWSALPIV